jgi:hypothetical protein
MLVSLNAMDETCLGVMGSLVRAANLGVTVKLIVNWRGTESVRTYHRKINGFGAPPGVGFKNTLFVSRYS